MGKKKKKKQLVTIYDVINYESCQGHEFVRHFDHEGKYHGKQQCIHCQIVVGDEFITGYRQGIRHGKKLINEANPPKGV